MKNEEILAEIEKEINPTGRVGLNIGILAARLKYAEDMAENALKNLKTVYESIGNDSMASVCEKSLNNFFSVMGGN